MLWADEPQAASWMVGSTERSSFAVSTAMRPYSSAVLRPICHGPSISLPRHQKRTPCGCSWPWLRRSSDSVVPPGWLQYSMYSRASFSPRVPRFTPSMGSMSALRHQSMNSLVPNWLVSVEYQARSSRTGRSFRGPTPSSQL